MTNLAAVWLYTYGLSLRTIAKFFKVNVCSVYVWMKIFARQNYLKPKPQGDAVIVELDEMWHCLYSKKQRWIWKAYCRDTGQLIGWECGRRADAKFAKRYERLKLWDISVYFADDWGAYSDLIPPELLIQIKTQTYLIESNNFPQRHWFARFKRKTCVVSRSEVMVDLMAMLYAAYRVNKLFSKNPPDFNVLRQV